MVKGTRVSVAAVLDRLAVDLDVASLLVDYPGLTDEDVRACVEYGAGLANGDEMTREVRPRRAS